MTCHQTTVFNPVNAEAVWQSVSVQRGDHTDVVFTGRLVMDLHGPDGPAGAAITLWDRQDGGQVLAWTIRDASAIARRATVLVSLADVMDHLEECCRALSRDLPPWPQPLTASRDALATYLGEVMATARFNHDFMAVAGEALARCDRMMTP